MQITSERLLNDLNECAQIGATPAGGVTRLAFSDEDIAGRQWLAQKIAAAGLEYSIDGAGNQSAILRATEGTERTLLVGSHLDTVKNGGRYDGALGVLAALEALRTIKESDLKLPFNLEAISFTDEEGTVLGEFGSQAVSGTLTLNQLRHPRGGLPALKRGMTKLGLSPQGVIAAKRSPDDLVGYVELHIEQGTRLEEQGCEIGIVTGIVGIRSLWLTFIGEAAHAGTKPMHQRKDALWGTTDFVQRARSLIMGQYSPGVINFGKLELFPGSFNIVPAKATLAVEFRHGTESMLDEMEAQLRELAQISARQFHLNVNITAADHVRAAPSSLWMIDAIEHAAKSLSYKAIKLMSFAGHDAQAMSKITPSAMIFVPSKDGISHNPNEHTSDKHVIAGANTLLHTMLHLIQMANGPRHQP